MYTNHVSEYFQMLTMQVQTLTEQKGLNLDLPANSLNPKTEYGISWQMLASVEESYHGSLYKEAIPTRKMVHDSRGEWLVTLFSKLCACAVQQVLIPCKN